MTPNGALWISLVVGAVVMGMALVAILVARRSLEPAFSVVALIAFACAAWAFGELSIVYDRFDVLLWGLAFGVAGFAGGYALASTLLANLASRAHRVERPSRLAEDNGSAALLIVGDVDPDVYDERSTAADLDKLSEEGLLHVSMAILPFLFFAQKARYRAVGGTSPAAKQLDDLAERVSAMLEGSLYTTAEGAWLGGERDLAMKVLRAAEKGYRHITVAEAMVAGSLELDETKRRVDALRLDELGVSIVYTQELWGSERAASIVASQVMTVVDRFEEVGVILVGLGQPEERSHTCRSFDEHEANFLNRIRMLLVDRGLSADNVRLAWADWHGPDVTGSVRHLAALGCTRIVVSPACFPFGTVETMLDLPLAVRQARVDEDVSIVTLPAWHGEPGLAEEIRERALAALDAQPTE